MRYKYLPLYVFILIGWLGFLHWYAVGDMAPVDENLLRLHVKANSNSAHDQTVKLAVRDAVLRYLNPKLEQLSSPQEAKVVITAKQTELTQIADQVIKEYGDDYRSQILLGQYDFPTKSYGTMVVPAGRYEAVRILLGTGDGDNWWCILFPPLCFLEASELQGKPSDKPLEFRWKVAEWWSKNQQ